VNEEEVAVARRRLAASVRFGAARLRVGAAALILGWCVAAPAAAQTEAAEPPSFPDLSEAGRPRLSAEESRRLLEQPLPEAPQARLALLEQQFWAAMRLNERARALGLARQVIDVDRTQSDIERWVDRYLSLEFNWGSSGKAAEAAEAFITDPSLPLQTRALAALRQSFFVSTGDRAITSRLWSRADGLAREALQPLGDAPTPLRVEYLQVRSEIEQRVFGNTTASLASLREAAGAARQIVAAPRAAAATAAGFNAADARGMQDGVLGMLVYRLVAAGRPQEAIEVAQARLAAWRAGQLSDSIGARWHYRLATALVATQQYAPGLEAARSAEQMLERGGAGAASATRWWARREAVRALIGLRRWQEADASYREFLASMPPDALARTRAADNRLLALLAAKNGRFEEGIELAERQHRFRMRVYGPEHPQTREAAGVRAVVRLLRGEVSAAMADYEALFAATLDTPAGWLDLDTRGLRGYVFGIAFDEFLHFMAERSLKGERLDRDLVERALQVADRLGLGVTQRAINDSTTRVLAATPALRALLEAEQTQRAAVASAFSRVQAAQAEEDALRREAQTEAFKARPQPARAAHMAKLRQQREEARSLQEEALASRTRLEEARRAVTQAFPDYAELVTPTIANARQLRSLLQPGEALLVVHPLERATLVWLLTQEGPIAFATSPLAREPLERRVLELREMLDLGAAAADKRPSLRPEALHALWRELFTGIEPALAGVRSLLVASSSSIASLPLGALVSAPPVPGQPVAYLARRMAITQLPAPASLHGLRRVARPTAAPRALLGFGDPLFDFAKRGAAPAAPASGALSSRRLRRGETQAGSYDAETGFRYADIPPLPETRAELVALAAALDADAHADLVLGERATRRAVLAAPLADRRVVAFATHGLLPGELPGVGKPALAMAAEADPKESPLLELDDVLGLRLNAQWVLLSACNTAAGEQGGAAMSGLVRGFFFAGARSVLATHWAVETESAAALTAATFRIQRAAEVTRAEALRRAQLAMLDGAVGGGRWSHPFYWAPYALFGDPAR
jgi:CHAT domain-containing protein